MNPKYATKPSKSISLDPAVTLLTEKYTPQGQALLIIEAQPAWVEKLTTHFEKVVCQNSLLDEYQACQMAGKDAKKITCILGEIPFAGSTYWVNQSFDEIIYRIQRSSAQVHATLQQAFALLKIGGRLTVTGANQEGIKSAAKHGENLFGNLNILTLKSSCRLLQFQKENTLPNCDLDDEKYFVDREYTVTFGLHSFSYVTKPGIFSYRHTDAASLFLLQTMPSLAGKKVLDLACGCGVLALGAHFLGAQSVDGVDSNFVATECAKRNFVKAGLTGEISCADMLNSNADKISELYDVIICNPPFHHGSQTDYTLPQKTLETCLLRLNDGGEVYLVANQFLDYMRPGKNLFADCEQIAQDKSYRVYRFRKSLHEQST